MDTFCPTRALTVARMKLRHLVESEPLKHNETIVTRFGNAALIKQRRGGWLLRGGSRSDRIEAREWISLFMHEVVVRETGWQ